MMMNKPFENCTTYKLLKVTAEQTMSMSPTWSLAYRPIGFVTKIMYAFFTLNFTLK
jgi:hypothetical protein